MNIIISIKDFNLGLISNTFFESDNISDGNYDDDMDYRIHTFLYKKRERQIQSFTIPISLSNNFMEFSGLIFAYHVRLTRELTFCEVPIIFYCSLELEQLLRLTSLARILLTPNIKYVNINKYSFDDIQQIIDGYDRNSFDLNQFLEQTQINPTTNYDSHHNIDNEFSLIQWSTYIRCLNILPIEFKKEFESRLYFKYLKVKNNFFLSGNSNLIPIQSTDNTRVLLVDDEANKGWKNFYISFFKNSDIIFKDSGIDFKCEDKNNLILKVEKKVREFNPDVVLLDLRLHDSDFSEDAVPENLSGIKVLEIIKGINKGIQVVITTASNKAWNFNLAKQKGAFDFIIKDGFENPEKPLNKINSTLFISGKRAKYLIEINRKIKDIKALISGNMCFEDKDDNDKLESDKKEDKVRKKMFSNLDLAFELIELSYEIPEKHVYYAYCYLQLFILIEDFSNPNSSDKLFPILLKENEQIIISHVSNPICIIQQRDGVWITKLFFVSGKFSLQDNALRYSNKLDTNFFVSAILIYKYGNENSSSKKWTELYTVRNKVAHEGYIPLEKQISNLLDFILYFFDNSNESNNNISKGLTPISLEESLQALIQKLNRR